MEKERGGGIYDIVIQEDENSILLPKALRGNWLLANGSNRWDYTFNSKNAIIESTIWNYKSVEKKGKIYTIALESDGITKTVYAKLNKNGTVSLVIRQNYYKIIVLKGYLILIIKQNEILRLKPLILK
ncbi:hypothetical protein [Jejuia pallidilutea]|uniref:Uncharacterized protein n=1 Tax=Jejuia pallidilutea TaxID=504487 RepID=A0A090WS53_9FLAO|nr:hypothetical protein [Jejuia pallidilutea]GAL70252.1 hypothetical protein JCM19302_3374 [Jejuia pallidilutea]